MTKLTVQIFYMVVTKVNSSIVTNKLQLNIPNNKTKKAFIDHHLLKNLNTMENAATNPSEMDFGVCMNTNTFFSDFDCTKNCSKNFDNRHNYFLELQF